jgi:hypothetical protein
MPANLTLHSGKGVRQYRALDFGALLSIFQQYMAILI